MRSPPPEVRASWPKPNYVDPIRRGPALVIVEITALTLSSIILCMRLYTRAYVTRNLGWDDWVMVFGAILGVGVTVCVVMAATKFGWDLHIWDLTAAKLVASRQVSFAGQMLYCTSTALIRTSIFGSYLRLAPRGTWFRHLSWAGLTASALTGFAFTIALFAQCRPFASYWDLKRAASDCYDEATMLMAYSVLTAVLDFWAWVLPLPTLVRTTLPLSQRLALVTLFSFGLVVVVASCIRIWWVHYVLTQTYDVTWYGWELWIWTAVEVQLGLICGCVPWLKSLFKLWRTGQTVASGASGAARSVAMAGGTVNSKRVTAVRMDSLGKAWTAEGPGKGEYIDLERSSAGGDSHTELSKPTQWNALDANSSAGSGRGG